MDPAMRIVMRTLRTSDPVYDSEAFPRLENGLIFGFGVRDIHARDDRIKLHGNYFMEYSNLYESSQDDEISSETVACPP